jgi:hypothetical protein
MRGADAPADLRAPFPWFGGKSRAAPAIWERFGDVANYVEPFAGSLAVLLARPHAPRIETVNDADCVAPETRILRSNLTWARAGDVRVGDRLIGFDENNGPARGGLRAPTRYRRLNNATVTAVRRLIKPSYRLTFDDGTTVIASADHMWLGGSHKSGGRGWRWVRTENMVCNRATQRSRVLKVADVVEREESYEAGWLGGMLDGEGSINVGPGIRVVIAQNEGLVLDRVERLLADRGFAATRTNARRCRSLNINGGMVNALSLLMRLRPDRLIRKFVEKMDRVSLYGRSHRAVGLVSKEFLGDHEVVAIETDAHTFIAEGLASHNCYLVNFWRCLSALRGDLELSPEEHAAIAEDVARWADWPVNEADLHARHRWLVYGREDSDTPTGASFRERMRRDPVYFDAKIAGWWVWGLCAWIGSGWCDVPRVESGRDDGVTPFLGGGHWHNGNGVHAKAMREPRLSEQFPHLMGGGAGPQANYGRGVHGRETRTALYETFARLAARLRYVRVACGDWSRVVTDSVTWRHGTTAILLDPPYSDEVRAAGLYAVDSGDVAAEVLRWCVEHGADTRLWIALCGYDNERHGNALEALGWSVHAWKAKGGYGGQRRGGGNENAARERIWFSPGCLTPERARPAQGDLFAARAAGDTQTAGGLAGEER